MVQVAAGVVRGHVVRPGEQGRERVRQGLLLVVQLRLLVKRLLELRLQVRELGGVSRHPELRSARRCKQPASHRAHARHHCPSQPHQVRCWEETTLGALPSWSCVLLFMEGGHSLCPSFLCPREGFAG